MGVTTENSLILSLNRNDSLDNDKDLNFDLKEDNNEDSAKKLQNTLLTIRDNTVCEQFSEHY